MKETQDQISGNQLSKVIAGILVSFILGFGPFLSAQPSITVKMNMDSTKWAPVAYLSLIQDFTHLINLLKRIVT